MSFYLVIFIVGFGLSYLLTPLAGRLAIKLGAVDHPDHRKVHVRPVPRLGGLAIYLAASFAVLVGVFRWLEEGKAFLIKSNELLGLALAAGVIIMVGVADDFRSLKPREKFIGQFLAAVVLIYFGFNIDFIRLPYVGVLSFGFWAAPLTFFWLVSFMNIVNFIDGLDGLAAGVSAIAALSFFFYSFKIGQHFTALLSLAVAGASLGFLRHNFFPAKIFMGDTGSLFLGLVLGAVTVQGILKSLALAAFFFPLIVMGVPILDTFFAILRRLIRRRSITEPDKEHLHHRFLKKGFSQRRTVLIIYLWTALLCFAGLSFRFTSLNFYRMSLILMFIVSLIVAYYMGLFEEILELSRNSRKKGER